MTKRTAKQLRQIRKRIGDKNFSVSWLKINLVQVHGMKSWVSFSVVLTFTIV